MVEKPYTPHYGLFRVWSMGDKIKTSISVDKKLWERFRSKIGDERGLKKLSEDLIIEGSRKAVRSREASPNHNSRRA